MAKFNIEIEWSSRLVIEASSVEEAQEKLCDYSWRETFEKMLTSSTGIMENIEVYEEEVEEND